jgi:hypothetical protein
MATDGQNDLPAETPETPTAPEGPGPETVAEKPKETAETVHPQNDISVTVHALAEKVSLLEETVQSLIPQERDQSPVKKPWTHRGSWR